MAIDLKTSLQQFESKVWDCYLPIKATDAEPFIDGDNRRVKCIINKTLTLIHELRYFVGSGGPFGQVKSTVGMKSNRGNKSALQSSQCHLQATASSPLNAPDYSASSQHERA